MFPMGNSCGAATPSPPLPGLGSLSLSESLGPISSSNLCSTSSRCVAFVFSCPSGLNSVLSYSGLHSNHTKLSSSVPDRSGGFLKTTTAASLPLRIPAMHSSRLRGCILGSPEEGHLLLSGLGGINMHGVVLVLPRR
jgi:hypothetical protein